MALVSELSPEDHARRCLEGDPDAFGLLYDGLAADVQRLLVGLCLGLDHQQVEDLVQESFLRLFRRLDQLDLGRPLRPYLLGLARNLAIDHWRRRRPAAPLEGEPAGAGDVVREVARAEQDDAVGAALEALEPELRSVLALRHTARLTMEELAAALGCSVPTARARLRRAALMFSVELEQRGVLPPERAS